MERELLEKSVKILVYLKKKLFKNVKVNKKQIVLISVNIPQGRDEKIAFGLKEKGYEVIFIKHKDYPINMKDMKKYCKKVYEYNNNFRGMLLALKYNPLAYHIFAGYDYDLAEMLIRAKVGKIVFDNIDCMQGFLTEQYLRQHGMKFRIQQEKFCLENADGVCCRSFETQYLKKRYGYTYKKRILFLDYCLNKNGSKEIVKKSERKSDNMRFIYAGGLYPERMRCKGNCYQEIAEILERNQIHFYMFDRHNLRKDLKELSKSMKYFHMNFRIPLDKLLKIERQCDYGVYILKKSSQETDNDYCTDAKYEYCTTNKYFDYIDAGIPFVAAHSKRIIYYFNKFKVVYEAYLEDIEESLDYLEKNIGYYKRNIQENKEKMSILYHIPRLISFYQEL